MNPQQNFPLICVPVTGQNDFEIIEEVKKIIETSPHIIEWRADFYEALADVHKVLTVIKKIRAVTNLPLLFTIRSVNEGGQIINLSEKEKIEVMDTVCKQGMIQYLDYEIENDISCIEQLRKVTQNNQVNLILSYHNFNRTPSNEELEKVVNQAIQHEANIIKLAVMPRSKEDVYQLLWLTKTLTSKLSTPMITMSMGELGVLSRVMGWAFGSILTFGVGVKSSAPGQVSVMDLKSAIEATQLLTGDWRV